MNHDNLTNEQAAILPITTDANIIAGAGSGKTKTMVAKVIHDQRRGVEPATQIVVTFTNAGANEMRERLEKRGASAPHHLGTLHSLAFRMVRREWGEDVRVISDKEFETIIKSLMASTRIKQPLQTVRDALMAGDAKGNLGLLTKAIMGQIRAEKVLHPDVMLIVFRALLKNGGKSFVLYVDEAQDSARIDFEIYRALRNPLGQLIMFGDPRQAIFGFRGADPMLFQQRIGEFALTNIELTGNFRSGRYIVEAANEIANRMDFATKPMKAVGNPDKGEPPLFIDQIEGYDTTEQEIDAARKWVRDCLESDMTVAVLTRYNVAVKAAVAMLSSEFEVETPRPPEEADPAILALGNLKEIPADGWERAMTRLNVSFADQAKLLPALKGITSPEQIAEAITEGMGRPSGTGKVWVSTIHGAKGLEWDAVLLIGADWASMAASEQEDVRLAYVAITRAKRFFRVSYAVSRAGIINRVNDLKPSPFFK